MKARNIDQSGSGRSADARKGDAADKRAVKGESVSGAALCCASGAALDGVIAAATMRRAAERPRRISSRLAFLSAGTDGAPHLVFESSSAFVRAEILPRTTHNVTTVAAIGRERSEVSD